MQHVLEKSFTQQIQEQATSQQQSFVHSKRVTCLLIGCLALIFNIYRLGTPSIWFDEALSVERARQSLPVLWKIIFTTQPNMALYYLVLHYWLRFTHFCGWLPTEWVVRLPSAVFAALSSVVIYLFGRRFLGQRAGLVSAGLYGMNALQLTYAQETRSYSLQLLLVCASWYALLTAQTAKRPHPWWIYYTITASLAVYAQLFSVFVILAQVVTSCCLAIPALSWRKQIRDRFPALIASLVGILLTTLPILIASRHADKTGWLPVPHVKDIVHFVSAIAGGEKIYVWALSLACTLSLLSFVLIYLQKHKKPWIAAEHARQGKQNQRSFIAMRWLDHERIEASMPVTLAMWCWFAIPLIVSYVISQGSMRLFSTRYLIIIMPPLLYLAVLGLEALARSNVRSGLIALLFMLASFSVPTYYQSAQVEDWKQASFWLQDRQSTQDGIICYDNAQGCQLDIEYYMRAYPHGMTFPTDSPGSFAWINYDLTNRIAVDPAQAVDPHRLAAYSARHPRLFFIIGRLPNTESIAKAKQGQNWLDSHYQLLDHITTRTVTIRLYQTGGARTIQGT